MRSLLDLQTRKIFPGYFLVTKREKSIAAVSNSSIIESIADRVHEKKEDLQMRRILAVWYARPLSIYLIVALIAVSTFAAPAEAMFLPAPQTQAAPLVDRSSDMAMIQKTLESGIIQQRLMDYGLTWEEALEKMNGLTDEQLHGLAANINALQAGGRHGHVHTETVLIILLIVLLIVIIVKNDAAVRTSVS